MIPMECIFVIMYSIIPEMSLPAFFLQLSWYSRTCLLKFISFSPSFKDYNQVFWEPLEPVIIVLEYYRITMDYYLSIAWVIAAIGL